MKTPRLSLFLTIFFCLLLPVTVSAEETVSLGKQVSINYTLTLDDGTLVATTRDGDPLTYIHGTRNVVPGLENALEGMSVGDSKKITLMPEDAYGEFQSGKIVEVSKKEVRGDLKVGAFVEGTRATGEMVRSRILEVKQDTVVLDFNHPMAGKTLHYDVSVVGIQNSAASEPESAASQNQG